MNLKNIIKTISTGVVAIIGHHYGSQLLSQLDAENFFRGNDDNNTHSDISKPVETLEDCQTYFKQVFDMFSHIKTDVDGMKNKTHLSEQDIELISKTEDKLGLMRKDGEILKEILAQGSDPEGKSLILAERISKGLNYVDDSLQKLKENGSKFISDLDFNFIIDFDLNKIYGYLDTLTLHQEGALFNIFVLLVILVTIFSLLGVFFGNDIIKLFDLENKFPRLSTFFKLRAKFQRYYLM